MSFMHLPLMEAAQFTAWVRSYEGMEGKKGKAPALSLPSRHLFTFIERLQLSIQY